MVQFNFTFDPNVSLEQRVGFELAAMIWATYLTDEITVNLHIGATDSLGDNGQAVGGAIPIFHEQNYGVYQEYANADATSDYDAQAVNSLQEGNTTDFLVDGQIVDGNTDILLTSAQAKALGMDEGITLDNGTTWERDLVNADGLDGYILISNNFDWNYDYLRTEEQPEGTLDFLSMALHEIGHQLGFVSGLDGTIDFETLYSGETQVADFTILDLFRSSLDSSQLENPDGAVSDLTLGENSYFSIDGGQTNLGDFSTGDDYQASHWKRLKEAMGIMDPTLAYKERLSIGYLDLQAIDVLGWDVDYGAFSTGLDLDSLLLQAEQNVAAGLGLESSLLTDSRGGGDDGDLYALGYSQWWAIFEKHVLELGYSQWWSIFELGYSQWWQQHEEGVLELGYSQWWQSFEDTIYELGYSQWWQEFEADMLELGYSQWWQLLELGYSQWWQQFETFFSTLDTLYAEENSNSLENLMTALSETETLTSDMAGLSGGADDDILGGTREADSMSGGEGDDLIDGAGGNDLLWGDAGRDALYGFLGNDTLYGGAGDDLVLGEQDNDVLYGEDGHDIVSGGEGHDVVSGGAGRDDLKGGDGDDAMLGGTGDDRMDGGNDRDLIVGQQGKDQIKGGEGDDVIYGDDLTVGQNLVTNGSFEGITTAGSKRTNKLTGWRVSGGTVEAWQQPNEAEQGDGWIELDYYRSKEPSISQQIDVAAGEKYLLSFAYSPKAGYGAEANSLRVYWDGQLIDTITADGSEHTGSEWTTYQYELAGNEQGSAELRFEHYADGLAYNNYYTYEGIDDVGGAIDDVQVRSLETLSGAYVDTGKLHTSTDVKTAIRFEAEDMISGEHTDGVQDFVIQSNSEASGGQVLAVNPGIVIAEEEYGRSLDFRVHTGLDAGYYDVAIRYFDSSQNNSINKLRMSGVTSFELNADNNQFNTKVIEKVLVDRNDSFWLSVLKDNNSADELKIDYIEFLPRYDLKLENRLVSSHFMEDLGNLDNELFIVLDEETSAAEPANNDSGPTQPATQTTPQDGLIPLAAANSDVLQGGRGEDVIYGGEGDDIIYGEDPFDNSDTLSASFMNLSSNKVYSGHLYFYSTSGTWEEAQAEAELMGGNLVTFNDEAEAQWVANNFSAWSWTGLTDRDSEGNWQWVSGEANDSEYRKELEDDIKNTTIQVTQADGTLVTESLDSEERDYASVGIGSWMMTYYSDIYADRIVNDGLVNQRGIIEIAAPDYGGRDLLFGGEGNDQLYGNSGNDLLYGDDQNSTITGENHDLLVGGTGDDELFGGVGNDLLYGDAQTENEALDLPENGVYYNGSLYLLTDALSWTGAQAQAQSLGGNLVTINDGLEQQFLTNTFTDSHWIGLTDQAEEGNWQSINGEIPDYDNWNSDYRDRYDGGTTTRDYAYLHSYDDQWYSTYDTSTRQGIIEIESPYSGNDLMTGGAGDDTLKGGLGADIMNGSDAEALGAGEVDVLSGGHGNDRFILGGDQVYYTAVGNNDYALITDFNAAVDVVQLHGSASDYHQQQHGNNLHLSYGSELITIFENVTTLDLNSTSVSYV